MMFATAPNPISAPASAASKTAPITLLANDPPQRVFVAAGGGHVVASVDNPAGGSSLLEITGGKQRLIATIKGAADTPSVGTGASGQIQIVLQPCAAESTDGRDATGPAPVHCKLRTYDLEDGHSLPLPGTDGAVIGDEDHGRYVYVTPTSAQVGVHVTLGPTRIGEGRYVKLPLDTVLKGTNANPSGGRPATIPYTETPSIESIDLSNGVVAATVLYRVSDDGSGGSLLIRSVRGRTSGSTGGWALLAKSTFGGASGIARAYRAATVTPTGVRAFYDGGDNDKSFVGRWSLAGVLLKKIATAGTGLKQIDDNAAFDGDRLVVSPEYDFWCGEDGDSRPARCPIVSSGKYPLG